MGFVIQVPVDPSKSDRRQHKLDSPPPGCASCGSMFTCEHPVSKHMGRVHGTPVISDTYCTNMPLSNIPHKHRSQNYW